MPALQDDRRAPSVGVPLVDAGDDRGDPFAVVLVFLNRVARWSRKLYEGQLADPFRPLLKESFHGTEPLLDAFGVVQPVHAERHDVIVGQTVPPPHVFATLTDWFGEQLRAVAAIRSRSDTASPM